MPASLDELPAALTDALADAAPDLAGRFREGATMWCIAPGRPEHARHVAVEFVHPVIVGKAALPAVSVDAGGWSGVCPTCIRSGDVVVQVGSSVDVAPVARAVRGSGALVVTIGAGGDRLAELTDHELWIDDDDRSSAFSDGRAVLTYHLLWELTHLCLEHGDAGPGASDAGAAASDFLYPFLAGGGSDRPGSLQEALVGSTRRKMSESADARRIALDRNDAALDAAAADLADRFRAGGRMLTFGNGGSATDAASFAALVAAPPDGAGLPARSLSDDPAVITALANDVGFARVFSRQLIAGARPDDIAVGFSTSGNSPNVVDALTAAADTGLCTIGFAGHDGGEMAAVESIDHLFLVPVDSVHRVQETQAALAHALWRRTVARLGTAS